MNNSPIFYQCCTGLKYLPKDGGKSLTVVILASYGKCLHGAENSELLTESYFGVCNSCNIKIGKCVKWEQNNNDQDGK